MTAHEPTVPRRSSWVLAASGWVALAATLLPAGSIVRPVLVAAFFLYCPGTAALRRCHLPGGLEQAVLRLALSISISVLVAEAQTFLGWWSPRSTVAVLAAATTAGALEWPRRSRSAAAG